MGILKTAVRNSPDLKVRAVVRVPSATSATFSRLMAENNFISFFALKIFFRWSGKINLHPQFASEHSVQIFKMRERKIERGFL